MFRQLIFHKVLVYCVMAFVFFQTKSLAQEPRLKTRIFTEGAQTIQQQYFFKGGKDSIANGLFVLETWPNDSAALYDSFVFEGFEVEIKNGIANGNFIRRRAQLQQSQGPLRVRNYHLSLPTSGTAITANGQVLKGQPFGPMKIQAHQIVTGATDGLLFEISGEFGRDGNLQKQLLYKTPKGQTILAAFDEHGRPSSTWEIFNNLKINFEEGKPTQVFGKPPFVMEAENHQKENLDSRFLWWLEGVAEMHQIDLKPEQRQALLNLLQALELLQFENPILTRHLPFEFEVAPIRVALPLYAFGTTEVAQIAAQKQQIAELLHLVDSQKNYSPFYINHFKDKNLAHTMGQLNALEQQLKFLDQQLVLLQHRFAQYLDRQAIMAHRMKKHGHVRQSKIEFKEEQLPITTKLPEWDTAVAYTEALSTQMQAVRNLMKAEQATIQNALAALKVENDLENIDNQLVEKSAQLKAQIDAFSGSLYLPKQTDQFRTGFSEAAQKAMEAYAAYEGPDKLDRAHQTMACLTELSDLLKISSEIEQNAALIYKAYHVSELNPVTWTHMESVKHERIYEAYTKKLVPFFFDGLEAASKENCGAFKKQVQNIVLMQKHLLQLEEQNPTKINRKLRANDSSEVVLQKLNFTIPQ